MLILCYHSLVAGEADFFDGRCSRLAFKVFQEQMLKLREQMRPTPLARLLAMLAAGQDDSQAVAITFDDAFRNVGLLAAPLLEELGLTATVFVPTGHVAPKGAPALPLHFLEVEIAFRSTPLARADLSFLLPAKVSDLRKPLRRVRAMKEAKRALRLLPEEQRQPAQARLLSRLEVDPAEVAARAAEDERYALMDLEQLRALQALGWELGSHTVNHLALGAQTPERQEHELSASREFLAEQFGITAPALAYPYGEAEHIGDFAPQLARRLGYRCALTTLPQPCRPGDDLFYLPRMDFAQLGLV